MRQLLRDPRYTLVELILIIFCGAIWMLNPQWGIWVILIALSLFLFKVLSGILRFNSFDWLILVYFITAWVGYWAAYDQPTAWNKAWFIVIGILLYYSLREQPDEKLIVVSVLLFSIGVGVSFYFFLTYDFLAAPRRLEFVNNIGRWFMSVRPQTYWIPIHPNYVAGIAAVTAPFIFYPIWMSRKSEENKPVWFYMFSIVGLGVICLALIMATSRGVILAIGSGVGAWILWRLLTQSDGIRRQIKSQAVFPVLLFIYLCAVIAFLYIGPAQSGSIFSGPYFYGTGSRGELFSRSLYLVRDYPITGGGLGSFPGLYSQYLLGIPFFNVPNSHNLFLDVAIEQGLFGGISFLTLYIVSLWKMSVSVTKGSEDQTFKWLVLFSLIVAIIHGMVDNYLYNGIGSMLALFLIGLSSNQEQNNRSADRRLDFLAIGVITAIWIAVALFNLNTIRSIWYANLGAVQLAKVELAGFPNDGWAGNEIVPKLIMADLTLHSSLQFDPSNRTANQRLGMISMLRRDFEASINYLAIAHYQAPRHRGINKSLGYAYAWSGDMEKAQPLLSQLPEVYEELDVYTWWWETQGRTDLSNNAIMILDILNSATP